MRVRNHLHFHVQKLKIFCKRKNIKNGFLLDSTINLYEKKLKKFIVAVLLQACVTRINLRKKTAVQRSTNQL